MSWRAHISMHCDDVEPRIFYVECHTLASSVDEAKSGAEFVLDAMASGKSAFIRVAPEADEYRQFDTGTTDYKGYVRFSYVNSPGEWLTDRGHR